jgi:IS30 family transposase
MRESAQTSIHDRPAEIEERLLLGQWNQGVFADLHSPWQRCINEYTNGLTPVFAEREWLERIL